MKKRLLVISCVLLGWAVAASAAPFQIAATLTGDPRPDSPDNLLVEVTITGDDTSNQVNWLVVLDMSVAHPNVKLDEFYFNMAGAAGLYSFASFVPVGWAVQSPGTPQGFGAGGADFLFEALDPAGPPNAADVTNSQLLSFTMTKSVGNFVMNDFLLAPETCSSNAVLGCGQLGAHLQSLNAGAGQEDSGFALGNYREDVVPIIPEPTSLLLLGTGLAFTASRLRRRR